MNLYMHVAVQAEGDTRVLVHSEKLSRSIYSIQDVYWVKIHVQYMYMYVYVLVCECAYALLSYTFYIALNMCAYDGISRWNIPASLTSQ